MGGNRSHGEVFQCTEANCDRTFTTRSNRDRHQRIKHYGSRNRIPCVHGCGKTYFANSNSLIYHQRTCDRNTATVGYGTSQQFNERATSNAMVNNEKKKTFQLVKSSHGGNYQVYRMELHIKADIQSRLRHGIMQDARRMLQKQHQNVKFTLAINCIFKKALRPNVLTDPPIYFRTMPASTTHAISLNEILEEMYQHIWNQVEGFTRNGSGWVMHSLENIDIQVCGI